MARKIDFRINVETNGTGKITALTMSTEDLERATRAAAAAFDKTRDKFVQKSVEFSSVKTTLDGLDQAMNSITAITSELTAAYTVQIQAETQLATVMRERMAASEADIQAIKDLASAQQALGVIGDEVQLAGAQQVATFLTMRSSLETLLPAMNDLVAQQKGLQATGADAVAVANLMGKAMQGQTSALRRVGISFTEAQAEVMKTGTEMERAAMLAQIITDNVGHMNAELAKTRAGQMQQMANAVGDVKEQLGAMAMQAQPFIALAAQATTASTGAYKLYNGVRLLTQALTQNSVAVALNNKLMSFSAAAVGKFTASSGAAAIATRALSLALKGLMITTVVGIAVVALTSALEWFMNRSAPTAEGMDGISKSEERMKQRAEEAAAAERQLQDSLASARSKLETYLAKLKNFNGTKAEERKLVKELNSAYGETMGYFGSISGWYKALTENSKTYCRQLEIEARLRLLADNLALVEQNKHNALYGPDGKLRLLPQQPQQPEPEKPAPEKPAPKKPAPQAADSAAAAAEGAPGFYDPTKARRRRSPFAGAAEQTLDEYMEQSHLTRAAGEPLKVRLDAPSLQDYLVRSYDAEGDEIRRQMEGLIKELSGLKMPVHGAPTAPNLDGGPTQTTPKPRELVANPASIADAENNLAYYREHLEKVTDAETERLEQLRKGYAETEAQLARMRISRGLAQAPEKAQPKAPEWKYTDDVRRMRETAAEIGALDRAEYIVRVRSIGFDELTDKIKELQRILADTENPVPEQQRHDVEQLLATYERWRRDSVGTFDAVREGWSAVQDMGAGVQGLSRALDANASAWERISGLINATLQIIQSAQAIIALADKLKTVFGGDGGKDTGQKGAAAGAMESAVAKGVDIAATVGATKANEKLAESNKETAASFLQAASASYMAAHAYIPFGGYAIGAGFTAAAVATVEAVGAMKFADGGIVSGPTFGLIGEYPGAAGNPEVVAPLDRLRTLLRPSAAPVIVGGRLRASGRDLVCVLEAETSISGKSGRRNKFN